MPEPGAVVVGSSLHPQISIDELAPASSALNPCKPSIIQQRLLELLVGSFRCLLSAMASCFAESDIDSRSEKNICRLTPPQAHDLSKLNLGTWNSLGELSASRLARSQLHHTLPCTHVCATACPIACSPRQIPCLRLHLLSDLLQLVARMHHPPI